MSDARSLGEYFMLSRRPGAMAWFPWQQLLPPQQLLVGLRCSVKHSELITRHQAAPCVGDGICVSRLQPDAFSLCTLGLRFNQFKVA